MPQALGDANSSLLSIETVSIDEMDTNQFFSEQIFSSLLWS